MVLRWMEHWPKRRILAAWWTVQAVTVLAVMSLAVVLRHVVFKAPVGRELAEGWDDLRRAVHERGWWEALAVAVGVVTALQGAALWPLRKPGPLRRSGSSVWMTAGLCGLMCALVWTGAVLAALDMPWLLGRFDWSKSPWAGWWFLATPLLGWAVATPLLVRFVRNRRREDALARISSRLLLGTAIEVAAITPLDVMVRRKTDCYCDRGTFWALLACGTVGLASMGPAALAPLAARRRKRWYGSHCEVCGYDLSGTPRAERCPECGVGWKA